MARLPAPVVVVSTRDRSGFRGLTASSFTSVSLDPPLLLVCFDNESRTLPVVRAAGRFAVNVLRAGQEELAATFASKALAADTFAAVTHTVDHGVPVLDDALAWLACDLLALHPGGDHTIGVGAVTQMEHESGEPLLFFRGTYRGLA